MMLQAGISQVSYLKVGFPVLDGIEFVHPESIVRCESEGPYTRVYCNNQDPLLVCLTLKRVLARVPQGLFVRVHRSHAIGIYHLSKYVRGEGGTVILDDGASVPVSRKMKANLMACVDAG